MSDTVPNSWAGWQFGPYRLRRLLGRGRIGGVIEPITRSKGLKDVTCAHVLNAVSNLVVAKVPKLQYYQTA
jgi:hypothetical protein